MTKTVSVIGSTGSVGTQALDVFEARGHRVCALAAGKNANLLLQQAQRFSPRIVAIDDELGARFLREALAGSGIEVLQGTQGVCAAASCAESDIVLNAAVGIAGLRPTLAAIEAGKTVALANKESLVCAGDLVMNRARRAGVRIIPVDSEHSAIFQCMASGDAAEVERIIITASGGPFFGMTSEQMRSVSVEDALAHPNWSMGKKITIDSATLMNKGFEMIEAMHLFSLVPAQIEAVVHRESIIHSLVEFCDGSVIAQLSPPDMGLAVQYAIDWPQRFPSKRAKLDLVKLRSFTFYPPDERTFPALLLCKSVMDRRGNAGAVLNGANEIAVARFLVGQIGFSDIVEIVSATIDAVRFIENPSLDDILLSDALARRHAADLAENITKSERE